MERRTGSGRWTGSPEVRGDGDELLRVVREAASAEYDILGEMGRGERGSFVYLAREQASQKLVALRLRPSGDEYELSVVRELDSSVPAVGHTCPACNADLVGWGRFCSRCGKDISGTSSAGASREQSLDAVHRAAEGRYEVLGEMERPEGGGGIYFAREIESGRLVALRLTREQEEDGSESFALGVTQVIKPLAASMGATYASPPSIMESAKAPESRMVAPSIRSPQPTAKSPTPPSVLVPDAQLQGNESPARGRRVPVMSTAIVAAILLIGGGLFVRSGAKRSARDGMQDPTESTVIPAPASIAAPVVAAPESGFVAIGTLPTSARVTLDGKTVFARQVALLAGKYRLSVMAPGFRTASQSVDVVGGETLSWAPRMERARAVLKAPIAAPKAITTVAPDCLNAYSDKNWTAALTACTREAKTGNQSAQRNLGVIYDQGLGVDHDAAQAALWFRKAAETGNRDASFQLATMYENGRGVPKDEKQAIDWYRKAALLGDGDSQVKLGRAYEEGNGVNKDWGEAAAWYQRAADHENLFALNHLGAMYADGRGVHKDEIKAVKLYQAAAAKGDAQGQYNLATMYAKGRGIAKSDSAANGLYAKAAKQGYPDAVQEARHRQLKF